ncbi:MAG: glycoside hydrolase family 16 protein, partial [Verrucomicrobia bacterium]|nr:glycoside hydrolase family 16 protein [Verrucomicrobiota bacterium]
ANNEIQQYRDNRDNVRLEVDPSESGDGLLVIESRRQNTTQSLGAWTSGRINSKGKFRFKYGLIEVRAKLPPLLGSWPAIWMMGDNIDTLGWPRCGEIDIMEMGRVTGWNSILGTIHWNAPGSPPAPDYWQASVGSDNSNSNLSVGDSTTAFHVYRIEWTPSQIRWFVDGTNFYTQDIASITGSPNNPFVSHDFHFLLNNAMGGTMGGTVDTSGSASTRYEVDYIRVYQTDSGNTVLTQRPALSSGTVTLTYGQNTNRVVPILNYPHTLTVSGSIPGLTASVQTSAQPVAGFSGSTGKHAHPIRHLQPHPHRRQFGGIANAHPSRHHHRHPLLDPAQSRVRPVHLGCAHFLERSPGRELHGLEQFGFRPLQRHHRGQHQRLDPLPNQRHRRRLRIGHQRQCLLRLQHTRGSPHRPRLA